MPDKNYLYLLCLLSLTAHLTSSTRYLMYDVSPVEGFNLRRDVYIRMANLLRAIRHPHSPRIGGDQIEWTLVLPPWSSVPHWNVDSETNPSSQRKFIPWSDFFDLASLSQVIPVIEFEKFETSVMESGEPLVSVAFQLKQHLLAESTDRDMSVGYCSEPNRSRYQSNNIEQYPPFPLFPRLPQSGSNERRAMYYECLIGNLEPLTLGMFLQNLIHNNPFMKSIYLHSAETVINGMWSEWSEQFWTVRRSMVFAPLLRRIGDQFRQQYLNSSDQTDRTVPPKMIEGLPGTGWLHRQWPLAPALGGPYVALHWRTGDYLLSSIPQVPTAEDLVDQIRETLDHVNRFRTEPIDVVFLATDAQESDIDLLESQLKPVRVVRFTRRLNESTGLSPGGLAIVDQWIAAHASFFVGTYPSTFTFRITEERTIMGFDDESTFNTLCAKEAVHFYDYSKRSTGDSAMNCEPLTAWPVVFEPEFTVDTAAHSDLHGEL